MPHTHPQHIVAAGCLVTNADNHILLVRSPKRGWEFPGGQVEEGEAIDKAVVREVYEESGIRIALDGMAAIYTSRSEPPKVIFDFLGHAIDGELRTSAESLEVGWFPKNQAPDMITHPGYRDRIQVLMQFTGRIVYRVYEREPYDIVHYTEW